MSAPPAVRSPLDIRCPQCGRPPRERCHTRTGMLAQASKVHLARRKAAGHG